MLHSHICLVATVLGISIIIEGSLGQQYFGSHPDLGLKDVTTTNKMKHGETSLRVREMSFFDMRLKLSTPRLLEKVFIMKEEEATGLS